MIDSRIVIRRSRLWRRLAGLLLLGATAAPVQARQAAPAPSATATITGSVICADTNAPARLGKVILRSTTPSNAGEEMLKSLGDLRILGGDSSNKLTKEQEADRQRQSTDLTRTVNMMADQGHMVTIGLDGTYRFTNVPPGTYLIRGTLDGYIDPLADFSQDDFSSLDPAVRKRIAAAAQTVTVSGNEGAHLDLRLERGASISGRVLFEDGSPAIGWQVLTVDPPGKTTDGSSASAFTGGLKSFLHLPVTTDDTGHFRLAGLPSGDYILQARINARGLGMSGFNPISSGAGIGGSALATLMSLHLSAYSGSAVHLADAKPVSVHAGDERTGVEIVIPAHMLHAVSGHVFAKGDAHAVNFGVVELTDKNDSSVKFTAGIQDDGSFRFDYIPGASSYTLATHNVQDTVTTETSTVLGTLMAKKKTVHNYGQVAEDVQMMDSDIDSINLAVPVLP
jgi:hypothetical protein